MSDAFDYLMAHAVFATTRARRMPPSALKRKQRAVARVYHLLAKEAAYLPNVSHLDDFRTARSAEQRIQYVIGRGGR
jgi:hypothetical protein